MDRLTGRHPSGIVYVPQGMMPEALDLLAAYEDTGLTPEEVQIMADERIKKIIAHERMKKIADHMVDFDKLVTNLKLSGYHISGWDPQTDQTAIGKGEGPDARIVGYINRDLSIEWREVVANG